MMGVRKEKEMTTAKKAAGMVLTFRREGDETADLCFLGRHSLLGRENPSAFEHANGSLHG